MKGQDSQNKTKKNFASERERLSSRGFFLPGSSGIRHPKMSMSVCGLFSLSQL